MKDLLEIYILDLQVRGLSQITIKNKNNRLTKFCNYISTLDRLTKPNINKYIISLNVKDSTKKEYTKTISAFINFLYNEEYIDKPIIIKPYKCDKVIQPNLSSSDVKKVLDYLKKNKSFIGQRNYTIIAIMVDSGIRVSELTSLNVSDIDNVIKVKCKRKERIVPISAKLKLQLKKYLLIRAEYSKGDEALFISRSGNRLKIITIQKIIKNIADTLNIELHAHLFRHYYIQSLLKQGVSIYYISKVVGHENLSTTETYLRSMNEKDIIDNIKNFTNL